MSTAVWTMEGIRLDTVADTALKASARFWLVVTIIGQFLFGFAVASFYGLAALRGDSFAWSKFISHGFIPGDRAGNLAVAVHLTAAAIIMLAGAVQLVPQVRGRFPVFHRWNGRIYMATAASTAVAGIYMTWFRGSVGDLTQHIGGTMSAVLIWVFAAMALRAALARDFATHRRWALRLFMVVSAAWFYRLIFFLVMMIFRRPFGFDPLTFTGPFPSFMAFGQFLLPLTLLEVYLRGQRSAGALRRMTTAPLVFVVTLGMIGGMIAVTMAVWVPQVKAGFDMRISIAETLSRTIDASGVDSAIHQYRELKASHGAAYNFDENQLNFLGYRLLHQEEFPYAIRIFQLNVEAFPRSSNAYDSLAEAYMKGGDKAKAIANYRKALALNPKNLSSAAMLQKLTAP
jgi:hypothetical protein